MSTFEQPTTPSSELVAPVPPLHAAHEPSSRVGGSSVSLHPDLFAKLVNHVQFAACEYADSLAGKKAHVESVDLACSVAIFEALIEEKITGWTVTVPSAQRWRLRYEFMAHFYLRMLGDKGVNMLAILRTANQVNRETIAAQQREHAAEVATLHETIRDLNGRIGKLVAR